MMVVSILQYLRFDRPMFDMVFLERGAGENILYRSFCLCLVFIDWLEFGNKVFD